MELVWRICDQLPNNVINCTIRPLCKAAAQRYGGPQHRRVSQAQPVPPHAFAWRYLTGPAAEDNLKRLTYARKHELFAVAAAGGSTDNLAALLERMGGHFLTPPSEAAAHDAVAAAARQHHIPVVRCLLYQRYPVHKAAALAAMVRHCDLADVQWLLQQWSGYKPTPSTLAAAAASTTRDARAKLDWLLAEPSRPAVNAYVIAAAAARDDLPTVQRLVGLLAH